MPHTAGSALLADLAALLLFTLVGRASHRESLDVLGVATTLWPFLVGLAAGWLVARTWRAPLRIAPEGLVVWAGALLIGMLLRALSGQGVQVAFVVVATLVLAALILGWRSLAGLLTRRPAQAGR